MKFSKERTNLLKAWGKAQKDIKNPEPDKENPHFKSKYVSLKKVIETIKGPCEKNGLTWIQDVTVNDGVLVITTRVFMIENDEWLRTKLELPIVQKTPQGVGSSITYGRRYSLTTIFGIAADDDDDGNAGTPQRPTQTPARRPAPARPAASGPKMIHPRQVQRIQILIKEAGVDKDKFYEYLKIKSSKELTFDRANYVINQLNKKIADNKAEELAKKREQDKDTVDALSEAAEDPNVEIN